MIVELSSELEQLVRNKVDSGQYGSASEVLQDALALLEEQELYRAAHRSEIEGKIAQGYASLRPGKGVDGQTVFKRIEQELAAD
jgi:antitoxin ParD1/3/4